MDDSNRHHPYHQLPPPTRYGIEAILKSASSISSTSTANNIRYGADIVSFLAFATPHPYRKEIRIRFLVLSILLGW